MADGTTDPDSLRGLDRLIWALAAFVAAIVLAAPLFSIPYRMEIVRSAGGSRPGPVGRRLDHRN